MSRFYYVVTILRDNGRDERCSFDTYFNALKYLEVVRGYSDYKVTIERRCDDAEEKERLT